MINLNNKKNKSIENDQHEKFLSYIGKVDNINIILKYKPRKVYNKEIFFIQKKISSRLLCYL